MTTKELIEILKELDPDGNMEVCPDDGSGDTFILGRIVTTRSGRQYIALE